MTGNRGPDCLSPQGEFQWNRSAYHWHKFLSNDKLAQSILRCTFCSNYKPSRFWNANFPPYMSPSEYKPLKKGLFKIKAPGLIFGILRYISERQAQTSAYKGATGSRLQSVYNLTVPTLPIMWMMWYGVWRLLCEGLYVPYSFRTAVWVFYVPQEPHKCKCCERGSTIFRPYPRWLESLTVCRSYYGAFLGVKIKWCILHGELK